MTMEITLHLFVLKCLLVN